MSAHVAANRAELAAMALRRLAWEQDAFDARIDPGVATSRGEAARAMGDLYVHTKAAGSEHLGALVQWQALRSDLPIPSTTLRDVWADAWDAWALSVSP